MEFKIGHREAEMALLRAQDISAERENAVRSRLRALQRLGLAVDARRGQGRRAEYRAFDIAQMGLALELSQLGLTPERTIAVLDSQGSEIRAAIREAVNPAARGRSERAIYLVFDPVALQGGSIFFRFLTLDALIAWLNEQSGLTHLALVNLSGMIEKLHRWLVEIAASLNIGPDPLKRPKLFIRDLSNV
jgi:DNA-binding transcriptional MerR regulator